MPLQRRGSADAPGPCGAAIVSLFGVSDAISDAEVGAQLRGQYGEVRRVWQHPGIRGCRLVEFYDLRAAAAVRRCAAAL